MQPTQFTVKEGKVMFTPKVQDTNFDPSFQKTVRASLIAEITKLQAQVTEIDAMFASAYAVAKDDSSVSQAFKDAVKPL